MRIHISCWSVVKVEKEVRKWAALAEHPEYEHIYGPSSTWSLTPAAYGSKMPTQGR